MKNAGGPTAAPTTSSEAELVANDIEELGGRSRELSVAEKKTFETSPAHVGHWYWQLFHTFPKGKPRAFS